MGVEDSVCARCCAGQLAAPWPACCLTPAYPAPMQSPDCPAVMTAWVREMAAHLKSLDNKHLVTVGSEGGCTAGPAALFGESSCWAAAAAGRPAGACCRPCRTLARHPPRAGARPGAVVLCAAMPCRGGASLAAGLLLPPDLLAALKSL